MKIRTYIEMFIITLFAGHTFGSELKASDYSFTADVSQMVPVRQAMPVDLGVEYTGSESVDLHSIQGDGLKISFDVPKGWILREECPKRPRVTVRFPHAVLRQGETMSRRVYLQDYFSKITPGKASLGIEIQIWTHVGSRFSTVTLKTTISLEITEESDEQLLEHVRFLEQQIINETNADKRIELYWQLMRVSHSDVIKILTVGLEDPMMHQIHRELRRKIYELSCTFNRTGEIVDYLLESGTKYDEYFFIQWKARNVSLSEQEWLLLFGSKSVWTRLYSVNYGSLYQKQRSRVLERLERKLKEEMTYLEDLKKRVGPPPPPPSLNEEGWSEIPEEFRRVQK